MNLKLNEETEPHDMIVEVTPDEAISIENELDDVEASSDDPLRLALANLENGSFTLSAEDAGEALDVLEAVDYQEVARFQQEQIDKVHQQAESEL